MFLKFLFLAPCAYAAQGAGREARLLTEVPGENCLSRRDPDLCHATQDIFFVVDRSFSREAVFDVRRARQDPQPRAPSPPVARSKPPEQQS